MNLKEAVDEQARRFGQSPTDEFKPLAISAVSKGYREVGKARDWVELETSGAVTAQPLYQAGTVALTNGSHTATLTNPVDSSFRGAFFRKKGSENEYRIMHVDGSTIFFDQAVVDESGSVEFEIEKRFLPLPTECREIIGWENKLGIVVSLDHQGLRNHVPNYESRITETPFSVHGIDKFSNPYNAGTISAKGDETLITGTGTSWLGTIFPGWRFEISTVSYRVRRVESDTRIILYNRVGVLTGSKYKAFPENAKTVRLRGTFSSKKIVRFTYIRSVYDLVHDEDTIDLSDEATLAVLDFAQTYLDKPMKTDEPHLSRNITVAQGRLNAAWAEGKPVRPAFKMFPPLIPPGLGRG